MDKFARARQAFADAYPNASVVYWVQLIPSEQPSNAIVHELTQIRYSPRRATQCTDEELFNAWAAVARDMLIAMN